jgi:hypothetical protein
MHSLDYFHLQVEKRSVSQFATEVGQEEQIWHCWKRQPLVA